ncbi:MAG: hypothetical protein M1838_002579 [Thelocarpon superellum]|nr:MAG: hypothetical protein M1838_002579 [Thelocarpon superellum]
MLFSHLSAFAIWSSAGLAVAQSSHAVFRVSRLAVDDTAGDASAADGLELGFATDTANESSNGEQIVKVGVPTPAKFEFQNQGPEFESADHKSASNYPFDNLTYVGKVRIIDLTDNQKGSDSFVGADNLSRLVSVEEANALTWTLELVDGYNATLNLASGGLQVCDTPDAPDRLDTLSILRASANSTGCAWVSLTTVDLPSAPCVTYDECRQAHGGSNATCLTSPGNPWYTYDVCTARQAGTRGDGSCDHLAGNPWDNPPDTFPCGRIN